MSKTEIKMNYKQKTYYLQGDGIARLEIEGIQNGDVIIFVTKNNYNIRSKGLECILPEQEIIKDIHIFRDYEEIAHYADDDLGLFFDLRDPVLVNRVNCFKMKATICNSVLTELLIKGNKNEDNS